VSCGWLPSNPSCASSITSCRAIDVIDRQQSRRRLRRTLPLRRTFPENLFGMRQISAGKIV